MLLLGLPVGAGVLEGRRCGTAPAFAPQVYLVAEQ